GALDQEKKKAADETTKYKNELDEAAGVAFAALHDWGGKQAKATDTWWATVDTNLQKWEKSAKDHTEQWQETRGEGARLAPAEDRAVVGHIIELKEKGEKEAAASYLAGLDAESKIVVTTLIASAGPGGADLAGALTAGIRERVRAAKQPDLEDKLQKELLALPDTPETADRLKPLVAIVQPGWDVLKAVDEIHSS